MASVIGWILKWYAWRCQRLRERRYDDELRARGILDLFVWIEFIDDQPGWQLRIEIGRLLRQLLAAGDNRLNLFCFCRVQDKRRLIIFLFQCLEHSFFIL